MKIYHCTCKILPKNIIVHELDQLFDDISIKFQTLDGSPIINIGFWTGIDKYNLPEQTYESGENYFSYAYIGEPLKTINFRWLIYKGAPYADGFKCFTYFSYAKEEWKMFQARFEYIGIVGQN